MWVAIPAEVSLRTAGRRAGVSSFTVVAMVVFLAALALAVDAAHLWSARAEMRNAADAASLAAAQALVDDELLTLKPEATVRVVDRARAEAADYGQANPVLGRPLELLDNPKNDPEGDLVFGFLNQPRSREFQVSHDLGSPLLNAVRVTARRTRERGNPAGLFIGRVFQLPAADVVAAATAMLDRDVVGFRPVGRLSVPVVPLALLTDPNRTDPLSWEVQVERPLSTGGGRDEWAFDRAARHFRHVPDEIPAGDGLFEMHAALPLDGQPQAVEDAEDANTALLAIGGPEWARLCRQVVQGVTRDDLKELSGELALGWDANLFLPGATLGPRPDDKALADLLAALDELRQKGEPRVWPLFTTIRFEGDRPGQGSVIVRGFVAARLVKAEVETKTDQKGVSKRQLALTLQPAMLSTATAVTDAARRHAVPGVDLFNHYICKVRLVE